MDEIFREISDDLWKQSKDLTYDQVKHDYEELKKVREDIDDLATQFYLTFVILVFEEILKSKEEVHDGED